MQELIKIKHININIIIFEMQMFLINLMLLLNFQ